MIKSVLIQYRMHVAVIGANGGIGRELVPRLADAGHHPIGIVRDAFVFG